MVEEKKKLLDPIWRINNLYTITTKEGKVVPFRPMFYQKTINDAIFRKGQKRILILKARRMGFSTDIDVVAFDQAYFNPNYQASIVDLTQGDASEKLKTKCRFAYDKLHPDLKCKLDADSSKQLAFPNGSTVNAGKNARGGTNQFLHISEWGPIAHEDPRRSEEILTGALPSADTGIIVVESTFKGGKGGHFYELIKRAMETPAEHKTEKDFHFYFFPWHCDPRHQLKGDVSQIDVETSEYLDEKEEELNLKFTPSQRLFYYKTKQEQGIFMFREYPTTPEEAFRAPVEGAIYGDIISKIRAAGKVRNFEWDRSYPVYACFDIGWDDSTSVWFFQLIGREVYWIWHYKDRHVTAGQVAQVMRDTGIPIACYYLPHDGKKTEAATGSSYQGEFEKAGCVNVRVVERCKDIWVGINQQRDLLQRSWIHKDNCDEGIESLEAYHTRTDSSSAIIKKDPVHDWASHDCDGMRTGVEAINLGMVSDNSTTAREVKRKKMMRRKAKSGMRL